MIFKCIEKNYRLIFLRIIRRRSTLPHSLPCSTIDAKELNFRVRDGYGCGLFAIAAGLKWSDPELLNDIKSRCPINPVYVTSCNKDL